MTTNLFDENGMPVFDKSRLLTDEFEPFRYTLEFKTTSVVDMRVGGYQRAIRPYQSGGYVVEHIGTHVTGATIYCQVKVTIPLLSGRSFESFGDADNRGTPDGDTCLRTAESVAFKRAVCRALDISPVDFGNVSPAGRRAQSRGGAQRAYVGANERLAARQASAPKPIPTLSPTGDAKGVWDKCP